LEPTPAYHFFELFCGILSQHLTSKIVEAALNRLVEVHKWQKCLKQKVSQGLADSFNGYFSINLLHGLALSNS